MDGWSGSHFLQSIGWATLNSVWQMGLLWCAYACITRLFRLSAEVKYRLSVLGLSIGFFWFSLSFVLFLRVNPFPFIDFLQNALKPTQNLLNILLISASIAYLILLIFPSYFFFRNWIYVGKIKNQGLEKAELNYRLFVQKVATQLGIQKKVLVYLSHLVKSPMTIGFFKPIILLPITAFNNLTVQQAEAVLLHELSHIRRYDYLINLGINLMHTLLYFNPFVKLFITSIEQERENCCDQLVLQYGYDRVSYASALLSLERVAAYHLLVLGATGKRYLLNRVEKIIGTDKKKDLKLNQLVGLLAAFIFFISVNSILIGKEGKRIHISLPFSQMTPFHLFLNKDGLGDPKFVASGSEG